MTHQSGDPLRDLAQSTTDFLARFGATPELEASIRNFLEEVEEFIEAAREDSDPDHTAEEAADVIVTALNVLYAQGIGIDKLVEQVYAVIAKNDAKTHETHVLSDGKIRRRSPK